MSKLHNNAIRYGDEYQCSDCGKSWGVDDVLDNDIPPCTPVTTGCDSPELREQMLLSQVKGLKSLIHQGVDSHNNHMVSFTPREWHIYLNIENLRATINTHE